MKIIHDRARNEKKNDYSYQNRDMRYDLTPINLIPFFHIVERSLICIIFTHWTNRPTNSWRLLVEETTNLWKIEVS